MSAAQKKRPMGFIPIIPAVMLCISLAIHVWLYFRVMGLYQSIAGTDAELIRQEYEALSLKIAEGEESLFALWEENDFIRQRIGRTQADEGLLAKETPAQSNETRTSGNSGSHKAAANGQGSSGHSSVYTAYPGGGSYDDLPDWMKEMAVDGSEGGAPDTSGLNNPFVEP